MDLEAQLATLQQPFEAALAAFEHGERGEARRLAGQAAAADPANERAWLLLAVLANPRAARFYLHQAQYANPASTLPGAGLRWLDAQRQDFYKPNLESLPYEVVFPPEGKNPPLKIARLPMLIGLLALLLLAGGALGLPRLSAAFAPLPTDETRLQHALETALAAAQQALPSETPVPSPTPLPSSTPTATHTASATPPPTHTATATSTPTTAPSATKKPTQVPPTRTPTAIAYTVKRGDTLNQIAQRYGVTLAALIAYNKLANPSLIMPGQVIYIPTSGSAPPAPLPTAAKPAVSGQGKEIHIDISEQHLYAYENGRLVFSYVVSTGIGNSTRIGTFKVLDKIPNAYSSRFNIWMPYWMGIYYSGTLENGIHGLPKLWNGVELWGNLLGQPATYGCIEARTWEIKALYEWAEIGTPVIIRQ